jgi:5-methylcytosine-specific restriction endonuclease McrA
MTNVEIRSERVRLANLKGRHTKQQWQEMKEFFNHTCLRCYGSSGLANVVKDHIIPLYQGGSNGLDNLQPLCAFCNASKGSENIDWRIKYCDDKGIKLPEIYKPKSNG